MAEVDWHKCRFLESSDNLKPLVRRRFGREPSTSLAREIAACLQQGRLFYEAAASSPLEIRPLQLFYGMMGFSKALVVGRDLRSLATLRPAHGLKDISHGGCRIAELRVKIETGGTFQEFNDVVADLTRICYVDNSTRAHAVVLPSTKAARLSGLELSLRDILGRVPRLEQLYRLTFSESSKAEPIYGPYAEYDGSFYIQVEDSRLFDGRESLKQLVDSWRTRFPFLKAWRLLGAWHAWDSSHLKFRSVRNSNVDEFSESTLSGEGSNFAANLPYGEGERLPLEEAFHSVGGSFDSTYAISPIDGRYFSEFSLHYLGLFLLSTLVRYRPQIWMHAISRSVMSEAPADDQALSLIERFLDLNGSVVPDMVVKVLNPNGDRYAGLELNQATNN